MTYLSTEALQSLHTELLDTRHHKRGEDGFERPLYATPAKWAEVEAMTRELIARRRRDSQGGKE